MTGPTDIRENLVARYKAIYKQESHPDGMSELVPSIPFVDPDSWMPDQSLLIYGSSESVYKTPPDWIRTENGWNRHWYCFERWEAKDPMFRPQAILPYVHLEPVNRGGLLVAGAFLSSLMGKVVASSPASFIRTIAVGNFGKFAMAGDYAEDYESLRHSLPYIRADLTILRPAAVLMTHTTLLLLRGMGDETLEGPWRIAPVMQCQPFNLDRCGKIYAAQATELESRYRDQVWSEWMPLVHGRLRPHLWAYLAEVDEGWRQGRERA